MSFKFRIKKGSTDPARHDRGVCKGQFIHCGNTRHCSYAYINVYSLEARIALMFLKILIIMVHIDFD